jgi:ribonuclease P protein component
MLNKRNRISNRRLIEKLHKNGATYKNKYFIFKYLPSNKPASQFAVVVSGKVMPKAVDRNAIKRKISESLRINIQLLKVATVALIIVKQGVSQTAYGDMDSGIIDFFNQQNSHAE